MRLQAIEKPNSLLLKIGYWMLKRTFGKKEIVEITWINATENYYNLLAKPLGLSSDNLKVFG